MAVALGPLSKSIYLTPNPKGPPGPPDRCEHCAIFPSCLEQASRFGNILRRILVLALSTGYLLRGDSSDFLERDSCLPLI